MYCIQHIVFVSSVDCNAGSAVNSLYKFSNGLEDSKHQYNMGLHKNLAVRYCSFKTLSVLTICSMRSNQVKATAGNVDEAVRELPDANLVRYIYFLMFRCC